MSFSVLLITHKNLGKTLLGTLKSTFAELPVTILTESVKNQDDPKILVKNLCEKIKNLDQSDGVLILTDLYGSTPSNIAYKLKETCKTKIRIVSGLNAPMLMKIVNYPQLSLDQITKKVVKGGRKGIIDDENVPY
jgi:mannose PTS system EIIA component